MSRLTPIALVFTVIPICLAAQESSSLASTPFHGGQWAVQFGGGLNLINLGVLRFTSPRSAWVLDLDVSLVRLNGEQEDLIGGGPAQSADQQLTVFGTRVGKRFYQTPHGRVTSFQTVALEGFYANQKIDVTDTSSVRLKQWSAGVNGELGAAYMVTPNLSLGATAGISAEYLYQEFTNPFDRVTLRGFRLDGIQIVFVAGFYF